MCCCVVINVNESPSCSCAGMMHHHHQEEEGAFFATKSTISLEGIPTCEGIHSNLMKRKLSEANTSCLTIYLTRMWHGMSVMGMKGLGGGG